MTAQVPDTFIYKRKKYDLVGITGSPLISPEDFGMEPEMLHTACSRGFYATYEIIKGGIFLKELTMREKDSNYKPINKVMPKQGEDGFVYSNIDLQLTFSGKLRLARDFIPEFYIHMGFQKPTAYKTVIDLGFEQGHLVEVKDRSEEAETKRGAFKERYGKGNLFMSIDEAFSLDMDLEELK
jgi:hypothetical protein